MAGGQMATNTTYPSATGIPLNGNPAFGSFLFERHQVSLSIGGTPGTSPNYQVEVQNQDDITGATWVQVKNAVLTAKGQLVFSVIGQAIRVNANNGTSPGTGSNTPTYNLEVFNTRQFHSTV